MPREGQIYYSDSTASPSYNQNVYWATSSASTSDNVGIRYFNFDYYYNNYYSYANIGYSKQIRESVSSIVSNISLNQYISKKSIIKFKDIVPMEKNYIFSETLKQIKDKDSIKELSIIYKFICHYTSLYRLNTIEAFKECADFLEWEKEEIKLINEFVEFVKQDYRVKILVDSLYLSNLPVQKELF